MKKKFDLEEAKIMAARLKKEYKFKTKEQPKWLVGISPALQQDGSYDLSVAISNWSDVDLDTQNKFFDGFEGMTINTRIVKPRNYDGKVIEAKEELPIIIKKQDEQKTKPVEAKRMSKVQQVKRGLIE